jgi:hypothetical protein
VDEGEVTKDSMLDIAGGEGPDRARIAMVRLGGSREVEREAE